MVRLWDVPRPTARDEWQLWIEAQKEMELHDGAVRWLDDADWRARKERLGG